jgi:hypothetical protein
LEAEAEVATEITMAAAAAAAVVVVVVGLGVVPESIFVSKLALEAEVPLVVRVAVAVVEAG